MAKFDWIEKSFDDPDYDVQYDDEAMNESYTCNRCGCIFTLDEAASNYYSRSNGDLSYFSSSYRGDLCGHCAADKDNL